MGLQQRAPYNLRRHVIRGTRRFTVLLIADLAAFAVMREFWRTVRDFEAFGAPAALVAEALTPRGILTGWQYAVALLIGLLSTGNYGRGDQRRDPRRLFAACALATALPFWMTMWTHGVGPVAAQYAVTTLLVWIGLVTERRAIDRIVGWTTPSDRSSPRTMFVGTAGDCRDAMALPTFQSRTDFNSVGWVEASIAPSPGALGALPDLSRCLHESHAEIVVVCGYLSDVRFQEVADVTLASGCQLLSVPRATQLAGVQPTLVWRKGQPLIELTRPMLHGGQLFLKRMMDLVVGTLTLVVLAPVYGLIALAVKWESPGPIVFGQERLGRNGEVFRCLKFRSMHRDAETRLHSDRVLYARYVANSYKLPDEEDPRLTSVGRFLRKTSLDELPQMLNVLRGEMSLVGPRPIVPAELDEYGHAAPIFLSLKPGVTGAWQVDGRSLVGYPYRADIEIEYVRTWSLGRDILLLLKTIPAVLLRRGAH